MVGQIVRRECVVGDPTVMSIKAEAAAFVWDEPELLFADPIVAETVDVLESFYEMPWFGLQRSWVISQGRDRDADLLRPSAQRRSGIDVGRFEVGRFRLPAATLPIPCVFGRRGRASVWRRIPWRRPKRVSGWDGSAAWRIL
jgi:hypothetical protein